MGKDGDNNLGQIHVLPDWEFITFLDQLLHGCLFNIMIPHVRHQYVFHYPYRIHVYMLYMVTFTINIPQMLAYHTWILWVGEFHCVDLISGGGIVQVGRFAAVESWSSFSCLAYDFWQCITDFFNDWPVLTFT